MAVIGCDIPVRVSGAESIAAKTGVWTKTHFRQEGPFLVATTYLVAAGSPTVFEMRVDLRPLEKIAERIHARLHEKMAGGATVGFSFSKAWKSIKKTAKKIGRSKLVKSVGKAVKSVVNNRAFQIAMPLTVLQAQAVSRATGGKGIVKGPLGKLADVANSTIMSVVPGGTAANRTLAAFGAAKSAIDAAKTGQKLVQTALAAKNAIAGGNQAMNNIFNRVAAKQFTGQDPKAFAAAQLAARTALLKTSAATKAKIVASIPAVKKAAEIKARLSQPSVKAALVKMKAQADSAKKALQQTAYNARFATGPKKIQAQQDAKIVNLVARNDAKIAAVAQRNAGGLPGILIDKNGRITRGRFGVRAFNAAPNASLLYTAPGKVLRGQFNVVSGEGYPSRIANDIIGTCIQVQNRRPTKNLRISGGAPGLIGCDCGSEF